MNKHIYTECPVCGLTFIGAVYNDEHGPHTICPSCDSSFDIEVDEPDKELDEQILSEIERILGYENSLEVPQEFISLVRRDIQESVNYPDYHDSDITKAVNSNILSAIYYFAN